MLTLSAYLITGSAVFVVYLTYHRIGSANLPYPWQNLPHQWQNSVGKAYTVFFRKLLDRLDKKSPEVGSEADDELLETPMPVTEEMPTWVRVCQVGRETLVQLCDLCDTDVSKVEAGEMIPMNGVVTEGSAWVFFHQNQVDLHVSDGDISGNVQRLTVGDHVDARKIVLVGNLKISPEFLR